MLPSGIAIGIDGGASSLKWSVRDRAGRLRHGQSLGANHQTLDWETYTARLGGAIRGALAAIDAAPAEVVALGLGLAGVDRLPERERLNAWVRAQYPGLRGCWIGNDALPALRQGAGALAGLILIAGTGSICMGVSRAGEIVRVGGWGAALGDEGSGYWIGSQALRLACRMADGRHPRTPLLDEILKALGLGEAMELIPWVAGLDADPFKRQVAALAPHVLRLGRQGDPAAQGIFREALDHLENHMITVARRLDELEGAALERAVVCSGGLFEQSDDMAEGLAPAAARRNPPLRLVRLSEPASLGALHLGEEHQC